MCERPLFEMNTQHILERASIQIEIYPKEDIKCPIEEFVILIGKKFRGISFASKMEELELP